MKLWPKIIDDEFVFSSLLPSSSIRKLFEDVFIYAALTFAKKDHENLSRIKIEMCLRISLIQVKRSCSGCVERTEAASEIAGRSFILVTVHPI